MKKIFFVLLTIFLTACSSEKPAPPIKNSVSGVAYISPAATYVNKTPIVISDDAPRIITPIYTKTVKLSEFSTEFNPKDKNRANNLHLAASAINGAVVPPGEVFSYNETVGPTGEKYGYKKATIFIKGKKSKGYGGGVCQVSSTLFNAADLAGLEIVERHDHSRDVDYVPDGRDAATSYGGVDMKFKNTLAFPIKLSVTIMEGKITAEIWRA